MCHSISADDDELQTEITIDRENEKATNDPLSSTRPRIRVRPVHDPMSHIDVSSDRAKTAVRNILNEHGCERGVVTRHLAAHYSQERTLPRRRWNTTIERATTSKR